MFLWVLIALLWGGSIARAEEGGPAGQTIIWGSAADGRWQDASNWIPQVIPSSNDWVYITNRGAFTVTLEGDAACRQLNAGNLEADAPLLRFVTTGGTIWIGESFVLGVHAQWDQSSVVVGPGDLLIQGLWNWSQGDVGGSGVLYIDPGAMGYVKSLLDHRLSQRSVVNSGVMKLEKLSPGFPVLTLIDVPGITNGPGGRILLGTGKIQMSQTALIATPCWNQGMIEADDGAVFGIPLQNRGTFALHGNVTLRGGTNMGVLDFRGCCSTALNVYDTAGSSDPFVFAEGTQFTGMLTNIGPRLNIMQDAIWHSSASHPGWLSVGDTNLAVLDRPASFRISHDYRNTNTRTNLINGMARAGVSVVLGTIEVAADAVFSSPLLYLLPAPESAPEALNIRGQVESKTVVQRNRTVANSGQWLVTSAHNWEGGALTGEGDYILDSDALGRFVGTKQPLQVLGQQVLILGSNSVSGVIYLSDLAVYTVDPYSMLHCIDSWWQGGTGTLINQGTLFGAGDFDIPVINEGFVHPQPTSGLRCANFSQIDGETLLDGGVLGAGAKSRIEVRGGTILGTNVIAGNLRAAAAIVPGNPNGDLQILGSIACEPTCVIYLQLGGRIPVQEFPTLSVKQTAALGGVLHVGLQEGYYPKPGTRYPFLKANLVLNRFGRIVCDTFVFNAAYTSTEVILEAVSPILTVQPTSWSPNEGFRLSFVGDPAARYQVLGSGDLIKWTPLGVGHPGSGLIEYLDPSASLVPHRFYRVIQLDP